MAASASSIDGRVCAEAVAGDAAIAIKTDAAAIRRNRKDLCMVLAVSLSECEHPAVPIQWFRVK